MTNNVEAYNLVSPEALANPYPVYGELRRESPVHWSDGLRAWILSRYDDVMAALHDPCLSSDRIQQFATHQLRDLDLSIVADFLRIATRMMALQDMPRHTRLRKMASESFTRRALETFRPAVQQVADVLAELRCESLLLRGFKSMPLVFEAIEGLAHLSRGLKDAVCAGAASGRGQPEYHLPPPPLPQCRQ